MKHLDEKISTIDCIRKESDNETSNSRSKSRFTSFTGKIPISKFARQSNFLETQRKFAENSRKESMDQILVGRSNEEILELQIKVLKKSPQIRTKEENEFLVRSFMKIKFFDDLKKENGDDHLVKQCCLYMNCRNYLKGETVIKQGTIGKEFFVLINGTVSVLMNAKKNDSEAEEEIVVKELYSGASFGELALIENKPRAATVKCEENCIFAILSKFYFDQILSWPLFHLEKYEEKKITKEINFLSDIPLFSHWSFHKIKLLYWNAMRTYFNFNTIVYDKGNDSQFFHIIKSGEFSLEEDIVFELPRENDDSKLQQLIIPKKLGLNKKSFTIRIFGVGDYFGEEEIIENCNRRYRIRSLSSNGMLYSYSKKEFFRIIFEQRTKDKLLQEMSQKRLMINKRIQEFTKNFEKTETDRLLALKYNTILDSGLEEKIKKMKTQTLTKFMFNNNKADLKQLLNAEKIKSQKQPNSHLLDLLSQELHTMRYNLIAEKKHKKNLTQIHLKKNKITKNTEYAEEEHIIEVNPKIKGKGQLLETLKNILNPKIKYDYSSPIYSIRSLGNTNANFHSRDPSISKNYEETLDFQPINSSNCRFTNLNETNQSNYLKLEKTIITFQKEKPKHILLSKEFENKTNGLENKSLEYLPLKYKALDYLKESKSKFKLRKGNAYNQFKSIE